MIQQINFDTRTKRPLKPAAAPTVAQVRLRQRHSRTIIENAQNETSRRMADRLIQSWEPGQMIEQALEDLHSGSSFLRQEAQRFLEIVVPDRLKITDNS